MTGDRRPKGQPDQASGEDGSDVPEGLELATRGVYVLGRGVFVHVDGNQT